MDLHEDREVTILHTEDGDTYIVSFKEYPVSKNLPPHNEDDPSGATVAYTMSALILLWLIGAVFYCIHCLQKGYPPVLAVVMGLMWPMFLCVEAQSGI